MAFPADVDVAHVEEAFVHYTYKLRREYDTEEQAASAFREWLDRDRETVWDRGRLNGVATVIGLIHGGGR